MSGRRRLHPVAGLRPEAVVLGSGRWLRNLSHINNWLSVLTDHLALDVNQTTLTYNTEILTRYADVETASYLQERYERDLKKLKENDASTTFEVKEVKVFPDSNVVHAEGILKHFIGSKCIKENPETYAVSFKTYRGRLFFREIKKVEESNEKSDD